MLGFTRGLGFVVGLGAAVAFATAAPLSSKEAKEHSSHGTSGTFGIDQATGLLTGSAEAGQPVSVVVQRLGALVSAAVEIRGDPGVLDISVRLDGLDVYEALQRVAEDHSLIVIQDAPTGSAPATRKSTSTTVQRIVLVAADSHSQPSRRSTERREATKETSADNAEDLRTQRAIAQREIVELSGGQGPEALRRLRELASQAEDPAVRRAALSGLARTPDRDNFAFFSRYGLNDPDASVRVEAARSLMRIDPERGRDVLEEAARQEEESYARDEMLGMADNERVERDGALNHEKLKR